MVLYNCDFRFVESTSKNDYFIGLLNCESLLAISNKGVKLIPRDNIVHSVQLRALEKSDLEKRLKEVNNLYLTPGNKQNLFYYAIKNYSNFDDVYNAGKVLDLV